MAKNPKLFETVNWEKFFKLKASLAGQLNDRCSRFLKASILDQAVCKFSKSLVYVDQIGYDLESDCGNTRVEIKAHTNLEKLGKKSKVWIRLTNKFAEFSLEDFELKFDHLLVIGESSCAVVDAETVKQRLIKKQQAIMVALFQEDLKWIYKAVDVAPNPTKIDAEFFLNEYVNSIISAVG
jgi:hypothetical protein